MLFVEVRVTGVADEPVMLLREAQGVRILPVWLAASAANAVLTALEPDAEPDHPPTHDLALDLLAAADAVVDEVRITSVEEGVFTARVVVGGSAVPARLSDAVALALRAGAPILATEEVLQDASVGGASDEAGVETLTGGDDAQLERFRAFLDTITPDDFGERPQP